MMKLVDKKHYQEAIHELFNYLIEYKSQELSDPFFNYFTFLNDILSGRECRKIEQNCPLIEDMESVKEWFWGNADIIQAVVECTLQTYIGAWLTAAFLNIYPELTDAVKSNIPDAIFSWGAQVKYYLEIVEFLNRFNKK